MTGVEKVHDRAGRENISIIKITISPLTPNPKPTLIQNAKNKTYLIYTYSFFQNS